MRIPKMQARAHQAAGLVVITIIYEDKLGGAKPNNYGLHALVLACVADTVPVDRFRLRATVAAIPAGGDSKVKRFLDQDGADIAQRGPLLALLDEDHVRDCYGLPTVACKTDVLAKIAETAQGEPTIVLLVRNLEDVIAACARCLGDPPPERKLRPFDRDRVLQRAAAAAPAAQREAVLRDVPSLRRLVEAVARFVTGAEREGPMQ